LKCFLLTSCLICTYGLSCVSAAEGCLVGSTSTGILYTGLYTSNFFSQRTYQSLPKYDILCPSQDASILHGINLNQVRVGFIITVPIDCRVVSGGYNGTVYTFDLVPCPLDDYIWILIFPLVVITYYAVRRSSFKLYN